MIIVIFKDVLDCEFDILNLNLLKTICDLIENKSHFFYKDLMIFFFTIFIFVIYIMKIKIILFIL